MSEKEKTMDLLRQVAEKYSLEKLTNVLNDETTKLVEKDIFICLSGIVRAVEVEGDTLELLKEAKNMYNAPIFAINAPEGKFLIQNSPNFDQAVSDLGDFSFCFKLSAYHIINALLAIVQAQVTGLDLRELIKKGEAHIEDFIADSLKKNANWNRETLTNDKPLLLMPVGAAGCGKSTFYIELSNVVNISCDNVRYLLFEEYGPCFASWESGLAWFVVNSLTDLYLSKGYHVFYNGVNTDPEYRSPITMESPDALFAGMPYCVRLVYFEPTVDLTDAEVAELKGINMWATPIDQIDRAVLSENVAKIIDLIAGNFQRTLDRTKAIKEGTAEQDPFDILYAVPAPVVKLFVEQSFNRPQGDNVFAIPRKDIPDDAERAAFYKSYADKVIA